MVRLNLKTDGLVGIHTTLMAFSYFLDDVIITSGTTESHFPSARTVFSPELKVVFYFPLGHVKERLINPRLAPFWRTETRGYLER